MQTSASKGRLMTAALRRIRRGLREGLAVSCSLRADSFNARQRRDGGAWATIPMDPSGGSNTQCWFT